MDRSLAPEDVEGQEEVLAEPTIVKKRSRKRNITVFVVVSIINVSLLALLWVVLITPAHTNSAQQNDPSIAGDVSSPLLGKSAPDFTLSALNGDGAKIRLADLKGKPVILNFWRSNCEPCNAEAPFLQRSWETRLQSQGVVLIGIDVYDQVGGAHSFLQKYHITYPNVQDTGDGATSVDYGVSGQPETFFIDRDGILRARWIAPLNDQGLQQELAKITR